MTKKATKIYSHKKSKEFVNDRSVFKTRHTKHTFGSTEYKISVIMS